MKTALTIAGSDASGGAGIQADIKTMTANGVYAMSVITALTAQNTMGVSGISDVFEEFICAQLDSVFADIVPDSVKIGMVSSKATVEVIAERLRFYNAKNIVVDPVMVATSGSELIKSDAVSAMCQLLFPIATVVTPNLYEAEVLSNGKIRDKRDVEAVARWIKEEYGCSVLVKGGHFLGSADDFLVTQDEELWLLGERIENPNTHGTGCTLSSAIASGLSKGLSLTDAVVEAKSYVSGAIKAGLDLGKGRGPLNHMYQIMDD